MSTTEYVATGVPIPEPLLSDVAAEYSVSESALGDALTRIHGDLVEGADAIHQYYQSGDTASSIRTPHGLAEVIFIPSQMWRHIPTELTDEMRTAVKDVHGEFARSLGASEETLTTTDPLVMPSAEIGNLTRAGLSRRQAEVQLLRNAGLTQAEIGNRLGLATNTVKVHCHRIDTKVTNANRLLDLVET